MNEHMENNETPAKKHLYKRRHMIIATAALLTAAAVFSVLWITLGGGQASPAGNPTQGTQPQLVIDGKDVYPTPQAAIEAVDSGKIKLYSRASGEYFYTLSGATWSCTYLKGVNMGLTLPTTDLNDPDIPYDTYMEWFGQIAAMNANTVKIFTVMNPDFYNAFADYNEKHTDNPLYLLQGIWFNETYMETVGDAFGEDGKIVQAFERACKETVDIIHGNSDYTSYGSIEKAVYDRDISKYVAGYILGLEWQPDFVTNTNKNNAERKAYTGNYLKTENASPFEVFLAQTGDTLISYETKTYSAQTPVAFLNWSTTDSLTHSNEPFPEEDAVSVDTEHIKAKPEYYAGLFAAIDLYPYYPEFINYQPEYVDFIDFTEQSNPYRAYLRDLKKQYSVPVIAAEFGVPSSRGIAHESVMGYNQGGLTEQQQGEYSAKMAQDLAREQFAGSMVFEWQDEWFKQTWNTVKYSPEDAGKRAPNVQSAEQGYGILSCEPGETESISLPDGDLSEWEKENPVFKNDKISVYAKTDEGYLYLMVKLTGTASPEDCHLYLPISINGNGSIFAGTEGLIFSDPADFLLELNGKNETRLLTDSYNDLFYYQYAVEKTLFDRRQENEKKNSGVYNQIQQFLSNEIVLPLSGKTYEPKAYESGLLHYGNGNPDNSGYDSLSDFYYGDNAIELRIPWYLLNVVNGSEKKMIGDFYQSGQITFTDGGSIKLGAVFAGDNSQVQMQTYQWNAIEKSAFHTRLKDSYQVLQSCFSSLMKDYS